MDAGIKKTILIVEDERSLEQLLASKFTAIGYVVVTACNGEEGHAKALECHPDVILLDVLMPKKDGVTMYDELRTDPWGKTVKVVFFSNIGDEVSAKRFAEDPNASFLLKANVRVDDLLQYVNAKVG